ncbi:transcriptional regulator [Bordetella genomosp. 5]|uniref:Transcriptional regulator n=1 Tax=Bordetella genomosp. 5 TaxID=1395608 RepID=A0A261THW0_9BORD|nr:response regulator transcription factor [Bordetella genomosp. 5]OZI42231.1 transcriptional regulator [Bordetella genomosp. 5]OZI49224.1 hypothetical protein CAL25_14400 [Bordetella genomosp. 5]
MRILIAEDHPEWGHILQTHVAQLAYSSTLCTSCEETLTALNETGPQILLTDALLSDGDIRDEIPGIRQRLPGLGIIVLTARTHFDDQIRALTDGADYYLIKPIKLPILTATLTALARRLAAQARHACAKAAPGWVFDRAASLLLRPSDGASIKLTDREGTVFSLLLQNPTFPVRHQALCHALGIPDYAFDPHRIDSLMYRVRKKLLQVADSPFSIRNVYAEGFLLSTGGASVQFSSET